MALMFFGQSIISCYYFWSGHKKWFCENLKCINKIKKIFPFIYSFVDVFKYKSRHSKGILKI